MPHANEELLRGCYDVFVKGDMPTVLGFFSDDIEFHVPDGPLVAGRYVGRDQVEGFFVKLMELSGGTFTLEVLDVFANEERAVVLTLEQGEREGRTLENHSVHVWQLREGQGAGFRGYNEASWVEFWS